MNDGLHWKQGHAFHLARQLPAAEKWLVQRSEGGISRIAIDLVYYTIYCLFHQLKCLIVPNSGCSTFGDATHLRSQAIRIPNLMKRIQPPVRGGFYHATIV